MLAILSEDRQNNNEGSLGHLLWQGKHSILEPFIRSEKF